MSKNINSATSCLTESIQNLNSIKHIIESNQSNEMQESLYNSLHAIKVLNDATLEKLSKTIDNLESLSSIE